MKCHLLALECEDVSITKMLEKHYSYPNYSGIQKCKYRALIEARIRKKHRPKLPHFYLSTRQLTSYRMLALWLFLK